MNFIPYPRPAAWVALAASVFVSFPAQAEPLMYIPLGGNDRIVIVDTATDKVVDSINGIAAVHGLAGTPDGRFLIAGSYAERAEDGGLPAKPAGVSADEHAAHHGGAPAKASQSGGSVSTLSVISTADGAVTRRIDVPGAVHHVAVSPNGRFAAVTHPNEGTVSVIGLGSYDVVGTVATGPLPNYAVFGPASKNLYVSNAGDDSVSAVDTVSWSVLWNTTVGSSPEHVVLSPSGAVLYVNNVGDGSVSVIDTTTRQVTKTIPVGSALHGIDLSNDGKTLFVAALGNDKILAVDLASGASRGIDLAPEPYHLATIRGAGKLYVSSADEPMIWVLDQTDLTLVGTFEIGGKGHQMVQGAGK